MAAKPSYPEKLLIIPAPLVRLREEELRAMIVVWGAICEAIRNGEEPVFRVGDLAALMAELTGRPKRTAYWALARLAEATLDGQRLLIREGRTIIRPGEALEPWISLVQDLAQGSASCNILHDPRKILHSLPPNNKEVPLYHGGGGYIHDHEPPPPPPDSMVQDLARHVQDLAQPVQDLARRAAPAASSPALRAMARAIGIVSKAGFAAVEASGLGPRALWRLWVRIREGRGGVGALVTNLVEAGEGARDLAPAAGWSPPPPVDPCPRCGEDLRRGLGWREACPACGARVRECSRCRELALAEAPCPWCGAEPPPPVPEAGAGEDPSEASDPPADPDRLRLAWDAALEALREAFPAAPDRLRLAAAEEGDGGWVLRVAVAGEPDEAVMGILHGSLPAFLAHRLERPVRILPDGRI